jgi:predicted CopG family antitoxin
MIRRSIRVTEEAYELLNSLKKNKKVSFSDVIMKYYPAKRKLAEVHDDFRNGKTRELNEFCDDQGI